MRSDARVARVTKRKSEERVCHSRGSIICLQTRWISWEVTLKLHASGDTRARGGFAICLGVHFLARRQGDIARSHTRGARLRRRKSEEQVFHSRGSLICLTICLGVHFLATSIIPFAKRNGELARSLMCIQKCHLYHIGYPNARYLQ